MGTDTKALEQRFKALLQSLDEGYLKVGDIKNMAGFSYRQINDWDSQGVLPTKRTSESSWRRFTGREAFVILVCKELRDKFGVPLKGLGFVKSCMLKKGVNHCLSVVERTLKFGKTMYLLTDLKTTFVIQSDVEIADIIKLGFIRGKSSEGYLLLNLSRLVDQMVTLFGFRDQRTNRETYQQHVRPKGIHQYYRELVSPIRKKTYQKVTVHTKGGNLVRVDPEREVK